MSPLRSLLSSAEEQTRELGHVVVWGTVGDRMANGWCSQCGRDVSVAASPMGLQEVKGRALHEACGAQRLGRSMNNAAD